MPLSVFASRSGRAVLLALAALAAPCLIAGCGEPNQKEPVATVRMVDLLELLPKAQLQAPTPQHVLRADLPVAGETRPVLFMHPPSRATYPPFRVGLESRLELTFGVSEKVWEKEGDGVQFSIYARPSGGEEVRIFSSYIDPKHEMRDRRWVDAVVTLGIYAGRDVVLSLETGTGPANNLVFDWAGWSKATLVIGPE